MKGISSKITIMFLFFSFIFLFSACNSTKAITSTDCPEGFVFNESTLTCEIVTEALTCPEGQHEDNGSCVVDALTCPVGEHEENEECVSDVVTCPEGQHEDGGSCVVDDLTCPVGEHEEDSACVDDISYYEEGTDELLLSLNRIDNAQFEVDFDAIFSTASTNNTNTFTSDNFALRYSNRSFGNFNDIAYIDVDDYYVHPLYSQMLYNKGLFDVPVVEDGFTIYDEFLQKYNNNNMTEYKSMVQLYADRAKNIAEWVVDNITVLDTWVEQYDNYNKNTIQYLLDYDESNDVVKLYRHYQNDLGQYSYEKILIYFDEKGSEVVEYFVVGFDSDGSVNQRIYYNIIDGLEFNNYVDALNSEGLWNEQYLGLNKNDEGGYTFYNHYSSENNLSNNEIMVSNDNGWQLFRIFVNDEEKSFSTGTSPTLAIYSPDANCNVMSLQEIYGKYMFTVYLPAMDGLEGLVIDEDSITTQPVHSTDEYNRIVEQGLTPLGDMYTKNNSYEETYEEGIQTSLGRFLNTDPVYNDSVDFIYLNQWIKSESKTDVLDPSFYNRLAVMGIQVDAADIETAMTELVNYLESIGLTYKFGDLNDLVSETVYAFDNYDQIINNARITNAFTNIDGDIYSSYEKYEQTQNEIFEYIDIIDEFEAVHEQYQIIQFEDMPETLPATIDVFYDMNDLTEGSVTLSEAGFDGSNITFTVPKSAILTLDREYSIFYSFSVSDKTYLLAELPPITYEGEDMVFNSTDLISVIASIPNGDYILSMFVGKETVDGVVRISNLIPVPTDDCEPFTIEYQRSDVLATYEFKVLDGVTYLRITSSDTESPYIYIDGYDEGYQSGEFDITLPETSMISALVNMITAIIDNGDGYLNVGIVQIERDGTLVDDVGSPIEEGSYSLIVSDASGNESRLVFNVTLENQ